MYTAQNPPRGLHTNPQEDEVSSPSPAQTSAHIAGIHAVTPTLSTEIVIIDPNGELGSVTGANIAQYRQNNNLNISTSATTVALNATDFQDSNFSRSGENITINADGVYRISYNVYFATNAAVALVGSALALVVSGTCLGLVAARLDDTVSVGDVFRQAIATIPAAWTLVALALAAVGAVPKLRLVSWAGIFATFGITILGPTLKFPGWALGISPLYHVPSVAASDPNWTGLCVVASIRVVLVVIGFVGFSRRDIHRI